jgi:ATP-dependent DNA helicase RecG
LLLGVNDDGDVTGVDPDCAEQLKKDFVTAINNPQKLHPPAYLSIDEVEIDSKTILRIFVPESSQVHRCNGRIFDRNEDGDFDITDHTMQVASLYLRKQNTYSENKVYPHVELSDLRTDLIAHCRKLAGVWTAGHPWSQMDDQELIQSAQLYQTETETGKAV